MLHHLQRFLIAFGVFGAVLPSPLEAGPCRVPANCAFSPVILREEPKVRMWREEHFPKRPSMEIPDVEDLQYHRFIRECPLCGRNRYHIRFLFQARDDLKADQVLALYCRSQSRHVRGRRVYAIRGRVRIVRRRPDDLMEAELLSAAGFHPHLGWVDESLEPGHGPQYVLSPLNRTRLSNPAFHSLLEGTIWRGMRIGHFACVAPSTPERTLHLPGKREEGVEHWILGIWPHQRHYIFRSNRLVAWYPKPGDPCPRSRPHPRGRCLPLWTNHKSSGCKRR